MSYDVYIEADLGGPEPMSEHIGNCTSNLTGMWRNAICAAYDYTKSREECGLYETIHGKCAADVVDVLDRAISDMVNNLGWYAKDNPSNGWGDAQGAALYLVRIRDAARRHPLGTFRISR